MSVTENGLDAFTFNGGPTLYSSENRIPAVEDVRNILIYVTFFTLFLAFLIIIPGIRKERFSTFICVTTSLFVGAAILVSNFGTSWHVASAAISSPYRAFSKDKIYADVRVNIGLQSVNITLTADKIMHPDSDINFNERFHWIGPSEMKEEYHHALEKGLPFPILTIAEYLSQDGEGFCWGRRYRSAGYFVSLLLWSSFATWLLMNLLLCAVPRYGVYAMQLTGALMLSANALYAILLPKKPLVIPFEGQSLTFNYGWCYWLTLVAGATSILVGASVTIIDTLFPNKFSTILEVDYDTPYRYFVGNDAHSFGPNGLKDVGQGQGEEEEPEKPVQEEANLNLGYDPSE
ncbi:Dual oxidase maturation factor 1 [Halotydeus destructor]|nr:Dual oxidase maturation factor 1 [Halotydeus destructor]